MHKYLLTILVTSFVSLLCCSASRTTSFLPEQGELFEQALAQVGLSPEDVRISDEDLGLWGGDKYRTNLHKFLFDNPWKTSEYTRSLSNGLLRNNDNLGSITTSAFQKIDCGVRLGLVGDVLPDEKARVEELNEQALAIALSELTGMQPEYYSGISRLEGTDNEGSEPTTELQIEYAKLPLEVKKAAALALFTVPRILRYRDKALTEPMLNLGLDPQATYSRVYEYTINTFEEDDGRSGHEAVDDLEEVLLLELLMNNIDWNLLSTGAALTTIVAQTVQQQLSESEDRGSWARATFEVHTPLGKVVLCSDSTHYKHGDNDILLLIDTDGDDHYLTPVATTPSYDRPLSITIDLNGNDSYSASQRDDLPSNAAGVFGYGVLIDVDGDDEYCDRYGGAGFGLFGYGMLADLNGNDSYDGWGNVQGSANMGAGVLLDGAGDDVYHAFKFSQAYAGTLGSGLLIDVDGSDTYLADMESHFNGGLYGPDHHVHFCQGSAFGRRGDFSDGHSWAGGFGMLLDGGECADVYIGDCYVQGNSYWYAVGIIVDKGGDDTYRCAQYSQGSAPHFSIGILQDEAGDDHYTVTRRQSMGHGRDWSLAWFEDAAGDDFYQGARTTLATSHVNAISVFWDRAGDDIYLGKGPSFGQSEIQKSGSARDWLLTLGLFVDGAGHDQYFELTGDPSYAGSDSYPGDVTNIDGFTPLDFVGDGMTWVRTEPTVETPGYCGVGIDAE